MPLVLTPWKRSRRQEPDESDLDEVEAQLRDPATTIDRLLVLRTTEGGLAFRMYGFPDIESANEYTQRHLWLEAQRGMLAFWALHHPPYPATDDAEAVVIVRDPYHQGVVQIYSFVDMDAALGFVREEFRNGMDLSLALIFWAQPVTLEAPPELDSGQVHEQAYTPAAAVRTPSPTPQPVRSQAPAPAPQTMKPSYAANGASAPAQAAPAPSAPAAPARKTKKTAAKQSRFAETKERILSWPGWDGLVPHMAEAAMLKGDAYERARDDKHGTGRARLIVAVAIAAAGFNGLSSGFGSAITHAIFAAFGWALFGLVVYWVGTVVSGGHFGWPVFKRLVRTLGIAASPAIFFALGIIPLYGAIPVLAVYVWILVTTVHAIVPALETDQNSAVVTSAFGVLMLFAVAEVMPALMA